LGVILLERFRPFEKEWLNNKQDIPTDALHYLVNYSLTQMALINYAATVKHTAIFQVLWPDRQPFIVQVLYALLIIDFFLYWVHRLSHKSDFFWYFHSIHHGSQHLYWLNGEKRHPLNQMIEGFPGITILGLLGAPQIVLIGALAILNVNMLLQHGNVNYKAGLLRYIFAVGENHRWHHEKIKVKSHANYGAFFIFWDIFFGTYYYHEFDSKVLEVGINGEEKVPQTYLTQLYCPFKRLSSRHIE
jgi:sterol desaturase/sphingolipid hydroxylase (fatty acid hydroxylase superfamily)